MTIKKKSEKEKKTFVQIEGGVENVNIPIYSSVCLFYFEIYSH